ncbi:MAG: mandelate racemase/muconate lactonizing enzyme family protein [Litorilinea sp.]
MSIATVETFVVRQKLDTPFYFSQWEYDQRAVCLVKVTTQDGQYGWGEGYGPAEVVAAGVRFLAPHLIGQDPLKTATLWQMLYRRALDFARRGVLAASLSALDIALWDLKGKLLDQPVSTLLGGQRRDRVPVYATGLYFTHTPDLPAALAQEAQGYVAQGFRAIKMKVGLGIEADVTNVLAVRAAIGPRVALMIDANHAYNRREALALAQHLEPVGIGWFEEPLSPEDYAGYAELRLRTSIPLAGGECEYYAAGFRHLVEAPCVDIAQPDLCAAGGLTEGARIAALCHTFGVEVTPHCWGTGIAFATGLHFTSTLDTLPGRMMPAAPLLEMDRSENPLRDELTLPRFVVEDGAVAVPTQPGLGVDVDADLLRDLTQPETNQ